MSKSPYRFRAVKPGESSSCLKKYSVELTDGSENIIGYVEQRRTSVWRSKTGNVPALRWYARTPDDKEVPGTGANYWTGEKFGSRTAAADRLKKIHETGQSPPPPAPNP